MRRLFLGRKAQSTLEYAVLIAIIGAGLVLLSAYVRRGYQGKLRDSSERLGEQFEPKKTEYTHIVESNPVTVSNQVTAGGDIITERSGGGTTVREDRTVTPWD